MMGRFGVTVLSLWLMLDISAGQAQPSEESPKANPFNRPNFVINLPATTRSAAAAEPLEPELRATLVTNGSALANINGTILSTGQTYQGYRVAYISEGRVVLSRNGVRVVLNVYDQQQGLDQDSD